MSNTLGIDPKLLEYGVASLAILALLLLIWQGGRILYYLITAKQTKDIEQNDKQTTLEQTLVNLASTALDESKRTREAYEKNNAVLEQNTKALQDNAKAMSEIVKITELLLTSFQAHNNDVTEMRVKLYDTLGTLAEQVSQLTTPPSSFLITLKDEKDQVVSQWEAKEEKQADGTVMVVVKICTTSPSVA